MSKGSIIGAVVLSILAGIFFIGTNLVFHSLVRFNWLLLVFTFVGIIVISLSIVLYLGSNQTRKTAAITIVILSMIAFVLSLATIFHLVTLLPCVLGIVGGTVGYFSTPKTAEKTVQMEETRICQGCGLTISIKHKYCPNCARKQDPLIICQKCGHQAAPDMKHCPECGNKL